jgi:hypothetical protein
LTFGARSGGFPPRLCISTHRGSLCKRRERMRAARQTTSTAQCAQSVQV